MDNFCFVHMAYTVLIFVYHW